MTLAPTAIILDQLRCAFKSIFCTHTHELQNHPWKQPRFQLLFIINGCFNHLYLKAFCMKPMIYDDNNQSPLTRKRLLLLWNVFVTKDGFYSFALTYGLDPSTEYLSDRWAERNWHTKCVFVPTKYKSASEVNVMDMKYNRQIFNTTKCDRCA